MMSYRMEIIMSFVKTTAVALAIALGSSSAAFAKAHDQGVADGGREPGGRNNSNATGITAEAASLAVGNRGEDNNGLLNGNRTRPNSEPIVD